MRFLRVVVLYAAVCLSYTVMACGSFHRTAEQPADGSLDSILTCLEGTPGATVRWIDAEDDSDRKTNAIWCRTVGPWVVEDFSPPGEFDQTDSLAIITWNIYIGGGDLVPFVEDVRAGVYTDGQAPIRCSDGSSWCLWNDSGGSE
jgi:hypothetical protein